MKSYIIRTNKHFTDMTVEFAKYGKVEKISEIFDIYKLDTEVDINVIKKISGVTTAYEEGISYL